MTLRVANHVFTRAAVRPVRAGGQRGAWRRHCSAPKRARREQLRASSDQRHD
jgi:hypothetical protein